MGQWFLGNCFLQGDGVATNFDEGFKWMHKSALQNNPFAQMAVGLCFLHGEGVATNEDEGVKWLQKAANTGSPVPQFMLGMEYHMKYARNTNDTQSAKDAATWFAKAADQGMESAQLWLGLCYQHGTGVQQDLVEAYKWMLLAYRGNPKPVIPFELLDKLSPKEMREGINRSVAFVPKTNAITFEMEPMMDWINSRAPAIRDGR